MNKIPNYTHQVAANAYIYKNGKFLLLKRTKPPQIWGPPGGRLTVDENPDLGLQREVKEETGLDIEVLVPANTWFGVWQDTGYLLSIDYIVRILGGEVKLSHEHSEFAWVSLAEMRQGNPVRLMPNIGFQLNDFENAKFLIDALKLDL